MFGRRVEVENKEQEALDEAARNADRAELLARAQSRRDTPFDYIIVGAGAAGGPMAARLAENGRTVLLIDAGIDPVLDKDVGSSGIFTGARTKTTYEVPALHAAATEDERMSWGVSVRHYADRTQQQDDTKYDAKDDPEAPGADGKPKGEGKGGIFYPRASGIGGCTTHYAMIVVRPNDSDWNRIAELTGDTSWRAERMQGYFARIENCRYYDDFDQFFSILRLYTWWKRLLTFINPRLQLFRGGHGRGGWQDTSFIDPSLILRITKRDRTFRRVLLRSILFLIFQEGRFKRLLRFLKTSRIVQLLDPNFGTSRSALNEQLSFIPIGTDGLKRVGIRDRLLKVHKEYHRRLVIKTQTLVKRVVFEPAASVKE